MDRNFHRREIKRLAREVQKKQGIQDKDTLKMIGQTLHHENLKKQVWLNVCEMIRTPISVKAELMSTTILCREIVA